MAEEPRTEADIEQGPETAPKKKSVPFINASDTPTKKESSSGLPRIRTYAADMSRVIQNRGETLATIVSAEKDEPGGTSKPQEKGVLRKRVLFGGGALLFIVLGFLAVVGVMLVVGTQDPTPDITENLIFPNQTITLEVGIDDVRDILAETRTITNMSLGEVARLAVTQNGVPLPPQEYAARLGLPSALTREVEKIMVGVHAFDRNQPFIIMEIAAYDRSFNALLSSERELGRLLGDFFAPHNATGAAPTLSFEDVIIRNIDVRQSESTWPIMYSYPQRTLLVITTNEFTLREILSRLSNQQR